MRYHPTSCDTRQTLTCPYIMYIRDDQNAVNVIAMSRTQHGKQKERSPHRERSFHHRTGDI
jgi:hypothetical protein